MADLPKLEARRRRRDREKLIRDQLDVEYVESWDWDLSDGGGYSVIVSRDVVDGAATPRWHLSVAHDERLPEWAHLVQIAHTLRPGVVFALGIQPESWWLNLHTNCLHLWELDDAPLVAQWRREGQGDTPT